MTAKSLPPKALLDQLLRYDADTGKLYWLERPVEMFADGKRAPATMAKTWNTRFADKEALTASSTGYRYGAIGDTNYLAHRVVWKITHDEEPEEIDHINGDRADNRIANLRAVSSVENKRNSRIPEHNTSGVVGVSRDKQRGQWEAHITLANRKQSLGRFDSFDDAVAARRAAEVKYGFHENHGRR